MTCEMTSSDTTNYCLVASRGGSARDATATHEMGTAGTPIWRFVRCGLQIAWEQRHDVEWYPAAGESRGRIAIWQLHVRSQYSARLDEPQLRALHWLPDVVFSGINPPPQLGARSCSAQSRAWVLQKTSRRRTQLGAAASRAIPVSQPAVHLVTLQSLLPGLNALITPFFTVVINPRSCIEGCAAPVLDP